MNKNNSMNIIIIGATSGIGKALFEKYAIADHIANNGTVTNILGLKNLIKGLNGIRIAGRVLTLTAVAVDAYEIYSSHYNPRTVTYYFKPVK